MLTASCRRGIQARRQPSEAWMMRQHDGSNARVPQDALARARQERERAEALLRQLQTAKAESERNLASSNEKDPLKAVTGRSSFDNGIAATRKLIESLDRSCLEAERQAAVGVSTCCGGRSKGESRLGALVGPVA